MRFAAIYGNGTMMGYSPQQVRAMSIWQFMAAVDGYITANTPENERGLSDKEKDDLFAWL